MKRYHISMIGLLIGAFIWIGINACTSGVYFSPPVADAGEDQSVMAGDTITLDGSGSYARGDRITSFIWKMGKLDNNNSKEGEIVTFSIPEDKAPGAYIVTLVVTSDNGLSDDDNVTITVNSVSDNNTPPVANDQDVGIICSESVDITLGATDPDGDPVTYNIVTNPTYGTVSISGNIATYTMNNDSDSINAMCEEMNRDNFTFKANDGKEDSNIATVSIYVYVEMT